MKTYIFKTTATMKEYNNKKWWLNSDIVRDIQIEAETTEAALLQYRDIVIDKTCISISNNALKNKQPIYVDTKNGDSKQVGYVITGKTEFKDDEKCKWSTQYIDLWITILTVMDTDFEENIQ